MNKSRLIQIIKSFDREEVNTLSDFIISNYHKDKNPEELGFFFEYILQFSPSFDQVGLSKENTYQALYPSEEWIPRKLDKLMTRLLKVIYQFIAIHYSHQHHNAYITICHFLQDRKLNPIFDKVLKKWNVDLEKQSFYSSEYLYEQFLFKEMLVSDQDQKISSKIKLALPGMLQSLDQFYIFTKLKYACHLLAIHFFVLPLSIKEDLESFEYLDQLITLPHVQLPVIKVYYHAFKMLSTEGAIRSENFKIFKKHLFEYEEHLSITQKKNLHILIRNFAIRNYHNGEKAYLKKAFSMYKDHLKRGFLYFNQNIYAQPFLNIITFGLRLKDFDWVHQFIQNHESRIVGPEPQELVYNYGLSLYHFYIQNYETALDLLPDNFNDNYYKIGAKRLELIIYFETKSEILDSKIDAFKIFIYRIPKSKITQKQKTANNNFIHSLRQIRHPKTRISLKRINKLKLKVESMNHVAEKDWLLGVINRLSSII